VWVSEIRTRRIESVVPGYEEWAKEEELRAVRNTQEAAAIVAAPIARALSGKIPKGKRKPRG
jgi:hypothetical protein